MNTENSNLELFPDINQIYSDSNQDKISDAYDSTFSLVLNIISQVDGHDDTNKFFNIIITLLKNILDNPRVDKYRKIKLSNFNIKSLFEINGVYEFFTYLGFKESFIDNDLFLYLEEENFDKELMKVILSYLNLLILNNEDNSINDDKSGYNKNENNLPTYEEINSDNNFMNKSIIDILKETSDNRKNSFNNNSISKFNNYTRNLNESKGKKDIKSILKETAGIRTNNSNYFSNEYNVVPNNNFQSKNNKNKNSDKSRFVTLSDLQFHNPDGNSINKNNFKINDEIGKKCLQLSNEFRKRNGLRPLEWDDHIWKISFEHSNNMGTYKVKFGHDGFNERIGKLPFFYHQANENVFMCSGVSEYSVSEMGVNGWINSPGHRKNLLSNTTHCAIATFRNNAGEYFLTQIFVRK